MVDQAKKEKLEELINKLDSLPDADKSFWIRAISHKAKTVLSSSDRNSDQSVQKV